MIRKNSVYGSISLSDSSKKNRIVTSSTATVSSSNDIFSYSSYCCSFIYQGLKRAGDSSIDCIIDDDNGMDVEGRLLVIVLIMVHLLAGSGIQEARYPLTHKWDTLVRKHFEKYQELIDANTYRLQRIQRGYLALPYPKYYNTELLTLALLRKKQEVGEVEQAEVDLYKAVDPCIATHFNRTFSSTWNLPSTGLALGGGLLAYSTYFNFSIPTRFVLTIVPVAIDWIWHTRDPINEQRSLDFLNWVVGYRKALCQAERRKTQFQNSQTHKLIKQGNLVQLGQKLISLAGK